VVDVEQAGLAAHGDVQALIVDALVSDPGVIVTSLSLRTMGCAQPDVLSDPCRSGSACVAGGRPRGRAGAASSR
jgi:hypothetical protein